MSRTVDEAIRGLRIVNAGLIAGLLMFLAVAVLFKDALASQPDPANEVVMLSVLGLFAAGSAVAYLAFGRVVAVQLAAKEPHLRQAAEPSEAAIGAYRQLSIVRASLIEGPAFFAVVIYMLTSSQLALSAAVLGAALLLVHPPSHAGLRSLIEQASRR